MRVEARGAGGRGGEGGQARDRRFNGGEKRKWVGLSSTRTEGEKDKVRSRVWWVRGD